MEKVKSKNHSEERKAIIYLLRQYGKTLKEIGECMGKISYVSISRQYKKAEEEIEKETGCYEKMKGIVGEIKL